MPKPSKDFSESDQEGAVFNMAVATLQRINYYLQLANYSSFNDSLIDWKRALDVIYREAITIEKSVKTKGNIKQIADIKKKVDESYKEFLSDLQLRRDKIVSEKHPITTDLKVLLNRYEIKLRELLSSKGLLMPTKEDPRFALGKF